MKYFRSIVKFIAIGFFTLVFIFALFPPTKDRSLKRANADSLDVYPSVCLGGWENPSNAEGSSNIMQGSGSFNDDNSAVLDQAQAQLFCGSFQGADESQQPQSVTLYFSWSVIFPDEVSTTTVATGTDSDDASWSSILDTTSTATSTTAASSTVVASSTSSSTSETTSTPASVSDPNSTSTDTTPATVATDTAQDTSAPSADQSAAPASGSSTPDQSASDQSSTSFLKSVFDDPFAFLISKTFADSSGTGSTDAPTGTIDTTDSGSNNFIDVSYSLDGTTWQDLGQVGESNWQGYSVTIPVDSWSDINNLQIQLSPLLTPDPPIIYVSGMWLNVNYSQSVLGILQEGASAALGAVTTDLSNTIDGALNNVTNNLADILPEETTSTSETPPTPPAPTPSSTPTSTPSSTPTPPLPPPPPPPPFYSHTLQTHDGISVNPAVPRWVPANGFKSYQASLASKGALPAVTVGASNTIEISGACTEAYYTILLFANPTDYETNPVAALLNRASPCINGNFSQTLSDESLPPQIATGTYYLVIANQGVAGPWHPYPELFPIVIGGASTSTSL